MKMNSSKSKYFDLLFNKYSGCGEIGRRTRFRS